MFWTIEAAKDRLLYLAGFPGKVGQIPGYVRHTGDPDCWRPEIEIRRDWTSCLPYGECVRAGGRTTIVLYLGWWNRENETSVLLAHEIAHAIRTAKARRDPLDQSGEDHGRRHRRATQAVLDAMFDLTGRIGPFWARPADAAVRHLNPWDPRRDTASHAHDTALVEILDRLPPRKDVASPQVRR